MKLSAIPPGIIVDQQLIELARHQELITKDFAEENVHQACYELRASDTFYETYSSQEEKALVDNSGYVLRPHSYVTVIVRESIALPSDVLARIMAKGQLFSIGIVPVNTYADPGFRGQLGITLFNASNRYLVIKPGQAIAKIEFQKLTNPVSQPYAGQHGYGTKIWPIPTQWYASQNLLQQRHIAPRSLSEIERSYGPIVRSLESRLRSYERKIWVQITLTILVFCLIFWLAGKVDWTISVAVGVVANVLTNLFGFGLKSLLPGRFHRQD